MKTLNSLMLTLALALGLAGTVMTGQVMAEEGCAACAAAKATTAQADKTATTVQASAAVASDKTMEAAKTVLAEGLNFTLEDQDGKKHSLADFADKVVVLEWINPECPFVVRHYKAGTMVDLAKKYADKGVVWLAIDSTSHTAAADSKSWISAHSLPYAILQDRDGAVGHQYKAVTTPHMYVIAGGKLVYQGAIDDDARGNKSDKVNYVAQALDEVLAGKEVSTSQTKPYGCSVKYKK